MTVTKRPLGPMDDLEIGLADFLQDDEIGIVVGSTSSRTAITPVPIGEVLDHARSTRSGRDLLDILGRMLDQVDPLFDPDDRKGREGGRRWRRDNR